MDRVDRRILAELQRDGRVSVTELAERVQLSVSPCLRRVRSLESSGVIAGYQAILNFDALGMTFSALVFATLRDGDRQTVATFEDAVRGISEVTDAQRLFGDPDYLLRVSCEDLGAFRVLYDEALSDLPGLSRLSSTLVMKDIVRNRSLFTAGAGAPTPARGRQR